MFGMKIWGRFGVFRDPLTITQNLSFPIPPKTTIGGMMAAILGIDYNDYFADETYFDFQYSLVIQKPIRKRSFAQNYIADYTKESETKHGVLNNLSNVLNKLESLTNDKESILSGDVGDKEKKKLAAIDKKLEKENKALESKIQVAEDKLAAKMLKPKPIFREILLYPEYLVFVKGFKFETEIIDCLQKHWSAFQFYLGNSEFAANYEYLESNNTDQQLDILDSFTVHPDFIQFEPGKKYTNIFAATRAVGKREYRDYKNIVFSDSRLTLKTPVLGSVVQTPIGEFNCEFI